MINSIWKANKNKSTKQLNKRTKKYTHIKKKYSKFSRNYLWRHKK